MLIGLTGYAGSGKDEVAKSLTLRAGAFTMGMSDALHDMAMILNPILVGRDGNLFDYQEIIFQRGYVEAKKEPAVREFLQLLGTEAVRNIIDENAWVWAAERKFVPMLAEGKHVAITGIRFPQEVNMVKRHAGIIVRVERPGYGPVNAHSSDQIDSIAADHVIYNSQGLRELSELTQEFIRKYDL